MGGFGILAGHALAATDFEESLHQTVVRDAEFFECVRIVHSREEQVLHGDEVIFEAFRLVLSLDEKVVQASSDIHLPWTGRGAGHFRQAVETLIQPGSQNLRVRSGAFQDGSSKTALLCQQSDQKMFYVDLLIAMLDNLALRGMQRILSLLGEAIDAHKSFLRGKGQSAYQSKAAEI